MKSKFKVMCCGYGLARTVVSRQNASFLSSNPILLLTSARYLQTITEVRQYLKDIVGAKSTYSDEGSEQSRLQTHVKEQSELSPRFMKDSLQTVVIPLSDDSFREKYINIYNRVRFGQLLENLDTLAVLISYQHNQPMESAFGTLMEDIDLFAGFIAYKHCDPSRNKDGISPLSIVTAMVDEVRIRNHKIDVTKDIIMRGHVTWTGRSSLEVSMMLTQENDPVLDAQFVMVAKDSEKKKSAPVHPLKPVTNEERRLFEQGQLNKELRLEEVQASLLQAPPTLEEKDIVHELFRCTLDTRSKSFKSRVLPEGSVWMDSTKLKNSIICFPQQRNIHNNIFGGFLMRQGYELAWANACVFSQSIPNCVAMDDIIFHCPVPIGSLLLMSSQINFVEGNYFNCRVHAEVMNPRSGTCRTSNEFHFMFTCGAPTPNVVPRTYGESMLYLDGRRRLKNRLQATAINNHS